MIRSGLAMLTLTIGLAGAPDLARADSAVAVQRSIDYEQKLGARVPRDLAFRDATGAMVTLGEAMAGRPAVLALAWYSCPNLCGITLAGLAHALGEVPFAPGVDFEVVAISIDPREGPDDAARVRRGLLDRYGGDGAGWHVLTGDRESIRRVADAVGFRFVYDEAQVQYAHPAGLTVLDGDGRVARYLFGVEYAARDLRLALLDAGEGRIGSPIDQLVLRCHSFDPATGQYNLAVMRLLRWAGIAFAALLAGAVAILLMRERRGRDAAAGPARR